MRDMMKQILPVGSSRDRRPACAALVLALTLVLIPASTPALAQSSGELRALLERIERLELELAALRSVVGNTAPEAGARQPGTPDDGSVPTGLGPSTQGASGARTGGPAIARLLVRVDQLESQLGRMTGELERLQFRYERLNTTVNQLAQDVNRVGTTSRAGDGAAPSFRQAQGPAVTSGPDGETAPANPDARPPLPSPPDAQSAEVGTLGVIPAQPNGAATPAAPATPEEDVAPVLPDLTGDVRIDYRTSLDLLYKGEFAAAELAFRRFAEAYPESDFLGEAYYWIGEALYVRELFKGAAEAYLVSARDYPENTKAADSLLKLAFTFKALGEGGQACKALAQIDKNYPSATEPVKRSVRKARADFRCG